jgi:hypothetical protein
MSARETVEPTAPRPKGARRVRIGAAIVVALAVAFVAWLILKDGDESDTEGEGPRAASVQQLRELATSVDHPVYWAGARPGETYELTRTSSGRIFIRYLPAGVEVGDARPRFLTVGTYPQRNGYEAVQAAAKRRGATTLRSPGGGLVVINRNRPASVYVGYPGENYQIEIYHPRPARARRVAVSGELRPIR